MEKRKSIVWFDPNFLWCSDEQEMMNSMRSLLGQRFGANAFFPYVISSALDLFHPKVDLPDVIVVVPEAIKVPKEYSPRHNPTRHEYAAWNESPERDGSISVHMWAYGLRLLEFLSETDSVDASGIPIFIYMDHEFHEDWEERIRSGNGTSHDRISEIIIKLKEKLNIVGVFKKHDLSLLTAIQDILEPKEES